MPSKPVVSSATLRSVVQSAKLPFSSSYTTPSFSTTASSAYTTPYTSSTTPAAQSYAEYNMLPRYSESAQQQQCFVTTAAQQSYSAAQQQKCIYSSPPHHGNHGNHGPTGTFEQSYIEPTEEQFLATQQLFQQSQHYQTSPQHQPMSYQQTPQVYHGNHGTNMHHMSQNGISLNINIAGGDMISSNSNNHGNTMQMQTTTSAADMMQAAPQSELVQGGNHGNMMYHNTSPCKSEEAKYQYTNYTSTHYSPYWERQRAI